MFCNAKIRFSIILARKYFCWALPPSEALPFATLAKRRRERWEKASTENLISRLVNITTASSQTSTSQNTNFSIRDFLAFLLPLLHGFRHFEVRWRVWKEHCKWKAMKGVLMNVENTFAQIFPLKRLKRTSSAELHLLTACFNWTRG